MGFTMDNLVDTTNRCGQLITFGGTFFLIGLMGVMICLSKSTDAANCGTGWPVQSRSGPDSNGWTFAAIDKQFSCSGQVTAWRYEGTRSQPFRAIVWRPVVGSEFRIVGINDIPAGDTHTPVTYDVPENERITVKPGDMIGWSFGTSLVTFQYGGTTQVRWIGGSLHASLEVNQVHDITNVGAREYSIEAVAENGMIGQWFHYNGGNDCLQNHDIVAKETSGLGQCSSECSTNEECLSINIQGSTCTLVSALWQTAAAGDYVTTAGCKYFYPV